MKDTGHGAHTVFDVEDVLRYACNFPCSCKVQNSDLDHIESSTVARVSNLTAGKAKTESQDLIFEP